jgi:hypothetical protein
VEIYSFQKLFIQGEREEMVQGGEMTQTVYAHMNKKLKKF